MANGKWQMANLSEYRCNRTRIQYNQSEERKEHLMAKYEHFEESAWFGRRRHGSTMWCSTCWKSLACRSHPASATSSTVPALSVSNNVAEGFERSTTSELLSFIAIARGSSWRGPFHDGGREGPAQTQALPRRFAADSEPSGVLRSSTHGLGRRGGQAAVRGPATFASADSARNAKQPKRRTNTVSGFSRALSRLIRSTIPPRHVPPAAKLWTNLSFAIGHLPFAILPSAHTRQSTYEQTSLTRPARQDERLLAGGQLPVGRPDLSLRQSAAQEAAEAGARQAAAARPLGHHAGTELHLRPPEPRHQAV